MKSDPKLAEILKPIWNKYCGIYSQLNSFEMPVIRFDGRIKVLAYTYYESNIIRVSSKCYSVNQALYKSDILPHEIAHIVDYRLNGKLVEGEQHNPNWQIIMFEYGIEPLTHYEIKQ